LYQSSWRGLQESEKLDEAGEMEIIEGKCIDLNERITAHAE
jgi:hypothetical protein